jgi:hypothetical protein
MDEYERGRINLRLHGAVFEAATEGQPVEAEAGAPASG